MSFAGPKDALIERGINATAARDVLMVAASGNAGPKSPPLYPAANPNVIAVSATDAQDKLFAASNRGGHIAISAPGVDLFLPAPDEKYQMTSGTSFSAAYVSGLAALVLERNPALKPDEVRAILIRTARDLGTPGRDDLFGAGEADAFAAVSAVGDAPGTPVAAVSGSPAREKVSKQQDAPADQGIEPAGARHGLRQVARWRGQSPRRRDNFGRKGDEFRLAKKLKKSPARLNVSPSCCDQCGWERLSLPIEAVFGASAHPPQAPI